MEVSLFDLVVIDSVTVAPPEKSPAVMWWSEAQGIPMSALGSVHTCEWRPTADELLAVLLQRYMRLQPLAQTFHGSLLTNEWLDAASRYLE